MAHLAAQPKKVRVMAMKLTDRQQEVLDFIRDFIEVNEYAPSFQEIARWIGVSRAIIEREISRLEAAGRLRRQPGWARTLWVVPLQQPLPEPSGPV